MFCKDIIRDRPFNLKRGGGYGFLFRSEFFFRTTQELEYLFFCRAKREIFFQIGIILAHLSWSVFNILLLRMIDT
jgi:hypothetical protein